MKIFFIALLCLATLSTSANATQEPEKFDQQLEYKLLQDLKQKISKATNFEKIELVMLFQPITEEQLTANNTKLIIKDLQVQKGNIAQGSWQAVVKVQGQNATETHTIRGMFFALFQVPVLNHHLGAKEKITEQDISYKWVRKQQISNNAILKAEALLGNITKRYMNKGSLLTTYDIAKPIIIRKNSKVKAVYIQGNLNMEMEAVAMGNGSMGDIIKILNVTSGKNIFAQVISPNKVQISKQ